MTQQKLGFSDIVLTKVNTVNCARVNVFFYQDVFAKTLWYTSFLSIAYFNEFDNSI